MVMIECHSKTNIATKQMLAQKDKKREEKATTQLSSDLS